MAKERYNEQQRNELRSLYATLLRELPPTDETTRTLAAVRRIVAVAAEEGQLPPDRFGIDPILHNLRTAATLCTRLSPDLNMVVAIMLRDLVLADYLTEEQVKLQRGVDVAKLLSGLRKTSELYRRHVAMESDNFRSLLMTFADDIRVIIIMIVDRLVLMKAINHHRNENLVREVAYEANFLYAPLAHRLGLYAIKGELEDLSLKYTNRDAYADIARQLDETKKARDAYIADFIRPVREKLLEAGLRFEMKGRTKSIYSIWNKLTKQKLPDIEGIYDLFAIRVIIDAPDDQEKALCWMAYSIVTDLYRPNPARLKDWISIPKSNGYESLHITVAGPDGRWVEVQIRTRRMDLVAEQGLAAHWRYKGLKSGGRELDAWMNNVRDILEAGISGPMELMRNFKMDFYDKEVFVFTPKGDLYKLPLGATVLDFAFNIHSSLGSRCIGGRVNGKNQKLNHRLTSGDTVEILTSATQTPKLDWLNFVVTSKARTKIRQTVGDQHSGAAELAKEMLQRRFKNRKIDIDEATLSKTVKKLGFKTITEFYAKIADQSLDIAQVVDAYESVQERVNAIPERVSAGEFTLQGQENADTTSGADTDVIVIGQGIKGINYRLAKCCNPIQGDDVFGFISAEGVIKVHRSDCPNAANIRARYPYRVINTRWSGKIGNQFAVTLQVVGQDDIGIVTNITSIINKEPGATLRSIAIDSDDGLFKGHITVGVNDTASLKMLIKKIQTVKGVKDVNRSK